MQRRTIELRIFWLLLHFCVTAEAKKVDKIYKIIEEVNIQQRTETNVFINFDERQKKMVELNEILKLTKTKVPQMIVTETSFGNSPLYEMFNKESLTIAWLTRTNVNLTLAAIDRILWRIHFKNILLIFDQQQPAATNLLELFQLCWLKGFISVMVWWDYQLYTYHPYPSLEVVQLSKTAEFKDKVHLNNFHKYVIRLPFVEFPPLCFSYRTRQDLHVRAGFFYKWIELFLTHHNATIEYNFVDMWSKNLSQLDFIKKYSTKGFSFVPIYVPPNDDYYERSNVIYLTKGYLLVPSAKEIATNLYLVISFDGLVWFLIVLSGVLFFMLMILINRRSKIPGDLGKSALQALNIIIFISLGSMKRKSLLYYILQLLFLFTGIFLTNYYSSSLSSLYTSKVFEPELVKLTDIAQNDLVILQYPADVNYLLSFDIPEIVKQRFRSDNNNELFTNRQKLNMSYMYAAHDELLDNIMFQQFYLKRAIARKIDQVLYERPQFVIVPHRSPMLDQFNRYLSYITENGLLLKILQDAKWDGVLSGNLKMLRDIDDNTPIELRYFLYAFFILIFGWLSAFAAFLNEIWQK